MISFPYLVNVILIPSTCHAQAMQYICLLTHHRAQIGVISTQAEELSKGQDKIQSGLTSLDAQLRKLDKGVSNVPNIVQEAREISEEVHTELCALSVLRRLGSPNDRYWDVAEADSHTFHWILRNEDDSNPATHKGDNQLESEDGPTESEWEIRARIEYKETQRDVNVQLNNWLRDGNGLFHISGKPGSGKSTLLKYLVQHPTTTQSLEKWAQPKRLALGRFFFWKPDHKQNSLDSLVRGLLCSLIQFDASLVHLAFPRCTRGSFEQLSLQSGLELTKTESSEAFNNLVKDFSSSKTFRFCFFIDGLDELDEEKDTTHSAIVSMLEKWTDMSAGSVKICVSSRHFPVFEDMPVHHRIRLQDLTKYDIINFVQNSLLSHHKFRSNMTANAMDCQGLFHAILERANGVFLWVRLVVRSVERGLSNADSMAILRERVRNTPKKLELLFKSLLDSIEDCHAQTAFLLLALAIARSADSGPRSYDLFVSECGKFFQAFETSKTGNIDNIFCVDNIPGDFELTPEATTSIKSKVFFRCKGLLEIISAKGDPWASIGKYAGERVMFLHRSIPEFLKTLIPKRMSAHGLSSLHVHNAACWMLWAEIEFLNSSVNLHHLSFRDQRWLRIYIRNIAAAELYMLRGDALLKPDHSTAFLLLDRAEGALLPAWSLPDENEAGHGYSKGQTWNTISCKPTDSESFLPLCHLFTLPLVVAAETSCHAYARWKVAQVPKSALLDRQMRHCLQFLSDPRPDRRSVGECSQMLNTLIESGADVNGEVMGCCGLLAGFWSETGGLPSFFDAMWIMVLFGNMSREFQQEVFGMIELLLNLGAMCRSVVCFGGAIHWFKVTTSNGPGQSGVHLGNIRRIPRAVCSPMQEIKTNENLRMICGQDDGIITLEKWVAYAKPPNMTTLLSLIKRNSCTEEARSPEASDFTAEERLHAAMLTKHGLHWHNKLVWFDVVSDE